MELGTSGFAVFLTHMKAAVVNGKGNAGKSRLNISRSDPIGRILGVVIVTVHRQTVRAEEIITVAVIVHVLGADIVAADRFRKVSGVGHLEPVGIGAVAWSIDEICTIQGEHQSCTSLAPSSRAFVINLSARIMVSSSQSPPRNSSKPSPPSRPKGLTRISVEPISSMRM